MAIVLASEEFAEALAAPGVLVVSMAAAGPQAVRSEELAEGLALDPHALGKKTKSVLVLVDPKQGLAGTQDYIAEVREKAPKATVTCCVESSKVGKNPDRVVMLNTALLASGADQVSVGPWMSFLGTDSVNFASKVSG